MDIFIRWDNDQKYLRLPILPESFSLEGSQNNTTVTVHNLGDVNLLGKRGLFSISFESFFPHEKLYFQKGQWYDPEVYIKYIKALFESNTIVHLIISGTDISLYCTIDTFSYGMSDKSSDINYSISFIEYREIFSTSKIVRPTKKAVSKSIKWKKGDTWQKLTKKTLGSSATWKKQQKNNKAVIKKAKKKYPKKKEKDALIGFKVVIKA